MRKFFQSFYGKLSAVFLVLLLVIVTSQILITMHASRQFISEVDQKLNLNLAADMAVELRPLLQDSVDFQRIGERIHYMMVMNPKVEIYLLDDTGEILSFYAEPGKEIVQDHVDLAPIRKFLGSNRDIPILGDDPRHQNRQKPFSAARLQIGQDISGYIYIIIGGEEYDSAASMLRNSYVVQTSIRGLIITLVVSGLAGLILFAFLTRRLRGMTSTVQQFREGDYDQRIKVDSNDEVGQLGEAFNQMADTIVENMEELQQTDRLRRELIANVSHDLRSPLASMQGYLETIMMKEDSLSEEEKLTYLKIILNNTESLNNLVHGLFELSKLDARQIEPEPEPFSVTELVQDVVMKFQKSAEDSGVKLTSHLPGDIQLVYADIGMIERALSNLIDNAIHYTPEDGRVEVVVTPVDDSVEIQVADTGQGIESEDLPHIFDRFYRGDKSRTGHSESTGLGLAIAQKIIELHEGTIEVESEIGVGTTFKFRLPYHG
ncbi:MAG: HAMP domain-containing histidine kinase [Candidatus Marinimicrobia bacterium]|nr:HAMP domain-containing histidine kinase [Candidatus Neomarinimicrobiota bacterium]MCF7829480.1 HAMP domain-containing histidine kinase [Candidatus Neomarinimicrobiota bacterium]MCF7880122.1 HAMP domain-containing histidine kinase [Candidatus Neomarinimicrobiota bacterium]